MQTILHTNTISGKNLSMDSLRNDTNKIDESRIRLERLARGCYPELKDYIENTSDKTKLIPAEICALYGVKIGGRIMKKNPNWGIYSTLFIGESPFSIIIPDLGVDVLSGEDISQYSAYSISLSCEVRVFSLLIPPLLVDVKYETFSHFTSNQEVILYDKGLTGIVQETLDELNPLTKCDFRIL